MVAEVFMLFTKWIPQTLRNNQFMSIACEWLLVDAFCFNHHLIVMNYESINIFYDSHGES